MIGTLLRIPAAFLLVLCVPACQEAPGRTLSFFNTHTRERLTVTYRSGNEYSLNALAGINRILRDHYSGDWHRMDRRLLDYLYDLLVEVRYEGDVHIISGYRSRRTNAVMHERDRGVAEGSLHTKGQALDFRLPGIDTKMLWDAARSMKRGGAGYYRGQDFVHIDTGRVRSW